MPPEPDLFNWLFVDMNSFFASVEQHLRPELRSRPVGIIPVESAGTCIIAASIDAKRRGIKVGTPVSDARQLCPGIALVKARPAIYVQVHQAVGRSIDRCAPIHKVYSIDEWAVRLVRDERTEPVAVDLATRIKREMLKDFSPWLTCSIGIAATRLLAKIACELKKPDGLTVLPTRDLPDRLESQKLDDFPGIGRSMLARLDRAGIATARQLWNLTPKDARTIWGSVQGDIWLRSFKGEDLPEQTTRRSTFSNANMLAPEHRNDAGAHAVIVRLLCTGAVRLRHHNLVAYRLVIDVSSYNGESWRGESTLDGTQDTLTLTRAFEDIWRGRPWAKRKDIEARWRPFSQVCVTLAGLTPVDRDTPSLFAATEKRPLRPLSEAIDRINLRWGSQTVFLGSVHNHRHLMENKIAFGRIPDDVPGV